MDVTRRGKPRVILCESRSWQGMWAVYRVGIGSSQHMARGMAVWVGTRAGMDITRKSTLARQSPAGECIGQTNVRSEHNYGLGLQ